MNPLKSINDLARHNLPLKPQISEAFQRFFDRGWYVLGAEVSRFEQEFARYCGALFCSGVANGTDALELALRALGIEQGDKVALVANAGGYGTIALNIVGASPVYVDVDASTFTMDVESLKLALRQGDVRAIVVTHLYGGMAPIAEIAALASSHGISLIEDCAQAHGAHIGGRKAGSWGDVSCFSFYPTKNLGALGDGGAVLTSDARIAAQIAQLRQYGWEQKYCSTLRYGRNSRLDEIQAAILNIKLPCLGGWNERRSRMARLYRAAIQHPDVSLPDTTREGHVNHLYVVRTAYRGSLIQHLKARDVPHDIHYPIPDHRQPIWGDQFLGLNLQVTERLCTEVLTLPCFPEMTDDEVSWVAAAINEWRR